MHHKHRLARNVLSLLAPERRWPVLVALVAIGGLYTSLPKRLLPLPDERWRWAPLVLVVIAALPLVLSHRLRMTKVNTTTAYVLLGILTGFMMFSLGLLVRLLPTKTETPGQLLRSAASLWITNVLVFACWYWRLDAGGPQARARRDKHEEGAFLFPQMTMSSDLLESTCQENWKPGFIDYLFLAFTSSTALSPTDSPVLSRWAKLLMMIQASISFTIIVLLAARAVNILPSGS